MTARGALLGTALATKVLVLPPEPLQPLGIEDGPRVVGDEDEETLEEPLIRGRLPRREAKRTAPQDFEDVAGPSGGGKRALIVGGLEEIFEPSTVDQIAIRPKVTLIPAL